MTPPALDAFVPPAPTGQRAEVLGELTDRLLALRPGERAVVALDGVDGAGKTVLARELAGLLHGRSEVARDPASPANARYVGGQRTYLAEVVPWSRATWVLDNTDLEHPVLGAARP